ncbi:MAG: hypothetical protein HFI75_14570 [Lachnospiraceae bacterium]|nr:hypothetical protein [Lachnospiraceae bacterium]
MAKVLDKFLQRGENDRDTSDLSSAAVKRANANIMACLKDMKQQHEESMELYGQIYQSVKRNTQALKEMQALLAEKQTAYTNAPLAEEDSLRTQEEQKEIITLAIKSEMFGFRADLAEAVREEIAGYNTSVKKMYDGSKQDLQDNLGNYERVINKEISLIQDMMEESMGKHYEGLLEEIKSVRKKARNYALLAGLVSLAALIMLSVNLFIIK